MRAPCVFAPLLVALGHACTHPNPRQLSRAAATDARVAWRAAPTPDAPPETPVSTDASAPPPGAILAATHGDLTGLRALFAWPDGWHAGLGQTPEGATVLAVARADGPRGTSAASRLRAEFDHAVTGAAHLDVDDDGVDEVVVWLAEQSWPAVYHRAAEELVALTRRAWMLDGARDEAAVRAALPRLNRFNAPGAGVPPVHVLLTMRLATVAQLRDLLAAGGVERCTIHSGNYRPHGRRCRHVAPARYLAEVVPLLRRERSFADTPAEQFSVPDLADGTLIFRHPTCATSRHRTHCVAGMEGPGIYHWVFEHDGAALRLVELSEEYYETS